ncbi:hypothetical protein, partial [Enterococcus sp. BWR-S5]|uniref:hypothetical protein n=1 Tax=Enterococcus sp. BWR-S5 TaxID=2787714 RepID=UPI0019222465
QRLSKKDHPELYALLDEYGEHLAKDRYTAKELKINRYEVTYIPGGGLFGKLGDIVGKIGAVDKLVKGINELKIGAQVLDQIKNAPSFARVREVEPDDMIPQQGLVTSDSNKTNNVDAGKQGKHQEGHKNNQQEVDKGESKSTWIDGTNGVAETQEAWEKGRWARGRTGTVKEYDAGRVVGSDGETTKIKVHIDKKGNLHGYPDIPRE